MVLTLLRGKTDRTSHHQRHSSLQVPFTKWTRSGAVIARLYGCPVTSSPSVTSSTLFMSMLAWGTVSGCNNTSLHVVHASQVTHSTMCYNVNTYLKLKMSLYSFIHSFIHYLSLTSPLYVPLRDSHHPGLRVTTCRERELTLDHIGLHTFSITQRHGGPPRLRDQLNAGATSETTRTWKTRPHSSTHSF